MNKTVHIELQGAGPPECAELSKLYKTVIKCDETRGACLSSLLLASSPLKAPGAGLLIKTVIKTVIKSELSFDQNVINLSLMPSQGLGPLVGDTTRR